MPRQRHKRVVGEISMGLIGGIAVGFTFGSVFSLLHIVVNRSVLFPMPPLLLGVIIAGIATLSYYLVTIKCGFELTYSVFLSIGTWYAFSLVSGAFEGYGPLAGIVTILMVGLLFMAYHTDTNPLA